MRNLWALLTVAAALIVSGCVQSTATPKEEPSAPTGSAAVEPESTTMDVGTIHGLVVDDEQRPLANASVGIVALDVEILTTEEGSFEFTGVPVGAHTVVAARLGYESVAKKANVVAGETVELTLILAPLAVDESYFLTRQHNVLFHVASTYPTWILNMTGLSNSCEGCTWKINTTVPATSIQWEIYGRHTVTNPQGDAEYFWIFRDNYDLAGTTGERIYNNAAGKLPLTVSFNKTVIKKTSQFFSQVLCDYYWFCFEERREMWFTAFYGMDVPDGFAARPKE